MRTKEDLGTFQGFFSKFPLSTRDFLIWQSSSMLTSLRKTHDGNGNGNVTKQKV